jgi:hypothetical protein
MNYSEKTKSFVSYHNAMIPAGFHVLFRLMLNFLFRYNLTTSTNLDDTAVNITSRFGAIDLIHANLRSDKPVKRIRLALILMIFLTLEDIIRPSPYAQEPYELYGEEGEVH